MNDNRAASVRQWAMVSSDEWEKIEARVRGSILVRDDFVYVPFPRLAANSNDQVAAAVESYKREAAVVDPRLSHEVTLAAKATALSDLCDQIRSESGIRVEAGRSVADEKVTVFCEKMPLRDVMRQLARPFGYTWLRSTLNTQHSTLNPSEPSTERRASSAEYRYELVQDLRSQLTEEELRNRDRNAALLALEREIERYRPLMSLSPDEASARAKTAPPAEKQMLEHLAGTGWGPLQMYFRLSPQELAALRAGQSLKFGQEPRPDEAPLPPEVARGVLERWRNERFVRTGDGFQRTEATNANGLLLAAIPEARAGVTLTLNQSELGRFTLNGGSGFRMSGAKMASMTGRGPYAVGQSPRVLQPDNRLANAALAHDPALRKTVTISGVQAFRRSGVQGMNDEQSKIPTPERLNARTPERPSPPERPNASEKVTSADVLETLHRASGMPIVADYYTRLYAPRDVTVPSQPLFEALNRLADTMRLRWTKDGEWLQFRSTSYYDDRMKEVPNRLLARWSKSRQEHGALSLEELSEIAQLSDTQLQAEDMAAGARELFGLEEWNLARGPTQRSHLRYLAGFTPAQREAALSPAGLPFARMSLAQQQEYIAFAFVRYTAGKGGNAQGPNVDLQELAHALLRIDYAPPIGFEWRRPAGPGTPPEDLFRVRGQTREAALTAALRIDPQASPSQIAPAERTLTFAYLWGRPEAGMRALAVRATDRGAMIWGPRLPPAPAGGDGASSR